MDDQRFADMQAAAQAEEAAGSNPELQDAAAELERRAAEEAARIQSQPDMIEHYEPPEVQPDQG